MTFDINAANSENMNFETHATNSDITNFDSNEVTRNIHVTQLVHTCC